MPLKAVAWLVVFILLTGMTLRRSSWGVALYMFTFYASPNLWWWGQGLLTSITTRWNLIAAGIFAVAVFVDPRPKPFPSGDSSRLALPMLLLFSLNATLVHFLFAANPAQSVLGLEAAWKQLVLCWLMLAAIRDKFDLKLVMWSVLLGAAYVGYEVVFNKEGNYSEGRLEGLYMVAGASGANALAALMALCLPWGGYLLFYGRKLGKVLVICCLVLIVEVVVRCLSRGNFLGLIAGAVWLAWRAKGRLRTYTVLGIALALLAVVIQTGENLPRVLGRYSSTFAEEDQWDASAQSRLPFWRQGLAMVRDHPFGSGAEAAFYSDLGFTYIAPLGETRYRSVHNGYLNIAAGWGIQGLVLYLGAIAVAFGALWRSTSRARALAWPEAAFLGNCLEASLMIQLVATMFGSTLDAEWYYWWIAMALGFERLQAGSVDAQAGDQNPADWSAKARSPC